MKINRKSIYFGLPAVLILLAIFIMAHGKQENTGEVITEIHPTAGNIRRFISTTGTVEPQNRLEIKPPIGGRIEKIPVQEGDPVKTGDILAIMSSTERAALLDAARLQGGNELTYWEKVYRPTPLIAPIDGKVIVRAVEPGQTITTSDAVIVLSDRLIVKADVDETDIGKVTIGQDALVSLDAYPDTKVRAKVDHISYESTIINNVTIYKVDILPEAIPEVFRSGMSANVDIIMESRDGVLIIPLKAVIQDKENTVVLLKNGKNEPVPQKVQLGISDDENVEIVSGLSVSDTVLITSKKYLPVQGKENGSNPFMPKFDRKKR